MVKEKKYSFLSWIEFNRQNNDTISKLEIIRKTANISAKDETNALVVTTVACEKRTMNTAKKTLAEVKTQTPIAEPCSIIGVPPSKQIAQLITTEIVYLMEEIESQRSITTGSNNTLRPASLMKNNGVASLFSNNYIAPIYPEVDNDAIFFEETTFSSSIIIANSTVLKNSTGASAALTLATNVIQDKDPGPCQIQSGMPPALKCTSFFAHLKNSLVKTRHNLGSGLIRLFRGKKINDDLFEALEEQLLVADIGIETTYKIINGLIAHVKRSHLKDAEALYSQLRIDMAAMLTDVEQPLEVVGKIPFVILMVGANGVGKTTTIGKCARQYKVEGKSVMLAAGDTFRAAAVDQLQAWGERNCIPVVAQKTGADSASVIFDAFQAAKARGIDVLIADTAGRLQNKTHLMVELKKIIRVMKKLDVEAPHEIMLTIDASTGQNAISQANSFNDAVGLTGIALTKLDGTAKGGVIFALADRFGIPIRYIGIGEGDEDLRPFKANDFIEALFAQDDFKKG